MKNPLLDLFKLAQKFLVVPSILLVVLSSAVAHSSICGVQADVAYKRDFIRKALNFSIPPIAESLTYFGQAKQKKLPQKIRVLVWNIFKGKKSNFAATFDNFSREKDLILLQEVTTQERVQSVLEVTADQLFYTFGIGWNKEKDGYFYSSGVATGASTSPVYDCMIRSHSTEPMIFGSLTKQAVLTLYPVENIEEQLLVVNIHAINLVKNKTYFEFIEQIKNIVVRHQGPILFAGDFNSWSMGVKKTNKRLERLVRTLESLGLSRHDFNRTNELGADSLDHVFTKNISIDFSEIIFAKEQGASDHNGLVIRGTVLP